MPGAVLGAPEHISEHRRPWAWAFGTHRQKSLGGGACLPLGWVSTWLPTLAQSLNQEWPWPSRAGQPGDRALCQLVQI